MNVKKVRRQNKLTLELTLGNVRYVLGPNDAMWLSDAIRIIMISDDLIETEKKEEGGWNETPL